jgi:hypothetical protein
VMNDAMSSMCMAITVSNARCVERALKALAEKPKREQLQQNDEKRDQDDKQCELSQVHGKRCARRGTPTTQSPLPNGGGRWYVPDPVREKKINRNKDLALKR